MSPSDFNLWGMGSSEKSRSVFFFSVHLHHSRNGPGNVPCLKSVCLAAFGRNRNLHSIYEAPVNSSFSTSTGFEVEISGLRESGPPCNYGMIPWASLHCRASQGPAPASLGGVGGSPNLGSFVQTLFLSEIFCFFCSGVWAKICWYLQHKRCFVFLLLAGPRVSIFFLANADILICFAMQSPSVIQKSLSRLQVKDRTSSMGEQYCPVSCYLVVRRIVLQ